MICLPINILPLHYPPSRCLVLGYHLLNKNVQYGRTIHCLIVNGVRYIFTLISNEYYSLQWCNTIVPFNDHIIVSTSPKNIFIITKQYNNIVPTMRTIKYWNTTNILRSSFPALWTIYIITSYAQNKYEETKHEGDRHKHM